MAKRRKHPDDGAHLSDTERAEFEALAEAIGPLEMDGTPGLHAASGPRDYTPPPDPDDERYVPPEPPPIRTPLRAQLPWWVIAASLLLLVLIGVFAWPRAIAAVPGLAMAWAIVTLLRRMPDTPDDREPQV